MNSQENEDIDFYDLDHTLFNTGRAVFYPLVADLAIALGQPYEVAFGHFRDGHQPAFTFKNWFERAGVEAHRHQEFEDRMRADVARRAPLGLFPGVIDLLERRRQRGVRLVLITAGDRDFQSWKFELLTPLLPFFAPEDRHYVPLHPRGSKSRVIQGYPGRGRRAFVDDSVDWHEEAQALGLELLHIRPQWADSAILQPHPGDGVRWHVPTDATELLRILEEGV